MSEIEHQGTVAMTATNPISRELLGKIVDEVFDGAIEDASVIEDIYAAIKKHETPPPQDHMGAPSGFIADVHAVVDGTSFGEPTAEKRGRNPQLPYVPVIDHGELPVCAKKTRTEQIKGFAFPDRAAAVEHAAKTIAFRRAYLFEKLKEPRLRALRQSHGLPADIPATAAPQPNVERPQDISTAPPMTDVLVWWPIVKLDEDGDSTDEIVGGCWIISEDQGGYWIEPEVMNAIGDHLGDDHTYADTPSHWMPLPAGLFTAASEGSADA